MTKDQYTNEYRRSLDVNKAKSPIHMFRVKTDMIWKLYSDKKVDMHAKKGQDFDFYLEHSKDKGFDMVLKYNTIC